jgi:hypothetical protein
MPMPAGGRHSDRVQSTATQAFMAAECHRKRSIFGAPHGISHRPSNVLGKAQIQLDATQIQLEYATTRRRVAIGGSHKVRYAKIKP